METTVIYKSRDLDLTSESVPTSKGTKTSSDYSENGVSRSKTSVPLVNLVSSTSAFVGMQTNIDRELTEPGLINSDKTDAVLSQSEGNNKNSLTESGLDYKYVYDTDDDYDRPGVCEILSVKINGIDRDWLRCCSLHSNLPCFVSSSDFKILSCGPFVFKSVLGKIDLNFKLEGGTGKRDKRGDGDPRLSKQVKFEQKERAKRDAKMWVAKGADNAAVIHNDRIKEKEPIIERLSLPDLSNWYSKNWSLPNRYKFMMVRGAPNLSVFSNGRWHEVGKANEVYNIISDIDHLIDRSRKYYPVVTGGGFNGFNMHTSFENPDVDISKVNLSKSKTEMFDNIIKQVMSKAKPSGAFPGLGLEVKNEDAPASESVPSLNENVFDDLFGDDLKSENIIRDAFDPFADLPPDFDKEDQPLVIEQIINPQEEIRLIPFQLHKFDNGYSIGENEQIDLSEREFNLLKRMGDRIKVPHLSTRFIDEVKRIPFVPFSLDKNSVLGKLGNFTGRNHPPDWNGVWDGTLIPINEADFISSFHDMMTNDIKPFERAFAEWWFDAGERLIGSIMFAKSEFGESADDGSFPLHENVVDRLGSDGMFTTIAEPLDIMDNTNGMMGGARGDKLECGRKDPLVAVSEWNSDMNKKTWSTDAFFLNYDASLSIAFQGRNTPAYGGLFYNASNYLQQSSSLRVKDNGDNANSVGPRFQPSLFVYTNTPDQHSVLMGGVELVSSDIGAMSPISFKPAYESLASLNPMTSYASVSSGNRSYTITPYGDLAYLVYLAKVTNLYIEYNRVNHFQGCFRMLRWAAMCESGSYDTFRGGWMENFVEQYYSQGVMVPSTQVSTSTIKFVSLSYYVNNVDTVPMRAVTQTIMGTGGKIAFLGTNGAGITTVDNETFILQLLMLGADAPRFARYGQTYDRDGAGTGSYVSWIDVACLFARLSPVHIVVFMGPNTPAFVSGPTAYDTIGAFEAMVSTDVAIMEYFVEDLIGTYIGQGWNYWTTAAYNLCVNVGCTDYYNQAMFFLLHNCSLSPAIKAVTAYHRYDTNVIAGANPTYPTFPSCAGIGFDANGQKYYQTSCGVELSCVTGNNAAWLVGDDAKIRVPAESGLEYLVIFGIAYPGNKVTVQNDIDAIKAWQLRYWCPEYMSQAWAETNRKYFYGARLYNKTGTLVTGMPARILNLYNYTTTEKSSIPAGLLGVHDFYQKVTATSVEWSVIQPSLGWELKHSNQYPQNAMMIPYQRPEYLVCCSKFTSSSLTVWGPSDFSTLATPKVSKAWDKLYTNFKVGNDAYELSMKLVPNQNVPISIDKQTVDLCQAAINLTEHYYGIDVTHVKASMKTNTVVGTETKNIYPSFRPIRFGNYMGAQISLYRFTYYDLEGVTPFAVTSDINSDAVIISRTLWTSMLVIGDNASNQTDMGDPTGARVREENFSIVDSLFGAEVEVTNVMGSVSSQENDAIKQQQGVQSSKGGLPVAGKQ